MRPRIGPGPHGSYGVSGQGVAGIVWASPGPAALSMPTTIRPFGGVRSHSVEFTVIVAVALPPAGMDAVGVPVTEIAGVNALKWPTSLGALSSPVLKRSKPATV